jgi:hypothetical protein
MSFNFSVYQAGRRWGDRARCGALAVFCALLVSVVNSRAQTGPYVVMPGVQVGPDAQYSSAQFATSSGGLLVPWANSYLTNFGQITIYTNAANQNLPPNIIGTYSYSSTNSGLGVAIFVNSTVATTNVLVYSPNGQNFGFAGWNLVPSNQIAAGGTSFDIQPPSGGSLQNLTGNWTDDDGNYIGGICLGTYGITASVSQSVALSAAALISGSVPPVPGYVAYFDPATAATNNGATLTAWNDSSGNGNTIAFGGGGITWSENGIGGRPGIFFNASTSVGTNDGFFSRYSLNTSITLFLCFNDYGAATIPQWGGSGAPYIFCAGTPADFNGWFISPAVGGPPGNVGYMSGTNGYQAYWGITLRRDPQVLCVRYDGVSFKVYRNGIKESDPNIQNSLGGGNAPQPNGIGAAGNFILGQLGNIAENAWNGIYGRIIVYPTALSASQVNQVNSFLMNYYGIGQNEILLEGDSITLADEGGNFSNLEAYVSEAFPWFQVANVAQLGRTTIGDVTNAYNWAPFNSEGNGVHIAAFMERVNDDNASDSIAITETNYLNWASIARSNGWQTIACTIPSYQEGDNNGTRTNLNTYLRTNWFGLGFNAICDYAAVPTIGTNGACSNSVVFFSDKTHPLSNGYQYFSNSLVNTIQSLIPNSGYIWDQPCSPFVTPQLWNSNDTGVLFWDSGLHSNLVSAQ